MGKIVSVSRRTDSCYPISACKYGAREGEKRQAEQESAMENLFQNQTARQGMDCILKPYHSSMNIENRGTLSRQIVGSLSGVTPSIEEEDRHQEHFKTDHLLRNLKGHTISSGAITMSAQGAKFLLNLVSTMILARLLSPRDFGLVAMVMTVTNFLRVFKDAGLSIATVQRERITHAQVSNLFWINIA